MNDPNQNRKGYKPSKVGWIPEDWDDPIRLRRLITRMYSGASVNGEDRPATMNEAGVLKVSAVTSGVFKRDENKAVTDPTEINLLKTQAEPGTILVSRANTAALVGASAIVTESRSRLFLPDKLWEISQANLNQLQIQYLAYTLASTHVRSSLSRLATGTSGSMKNITKSDLLSIFVAFPGSIEQGAIVDILNSCDLAIEKMEELIKEKQRLKKALMQWLLTGKVRLPEFEGEEWIPAPR